MSAIDRLTKEANLLAQGAERAYQAGDVVAALELAFAAMERLQLYAHLKQAKELLDRPHPSPDRAGAATDG